MEKVELKPCPFCGSRESLFIYFPINGEGYYSTAHHTEADTLPSSNEFVPEYPYIVSCAHCTVDMKGRSTVKDLIRAWNRRNRRGNV